MDSRTSHHLTATLAVIAIMSGVFPGCTPGPAAPPAAPPPSAVASTHGSAPTAVSVPTLLPSPVVTLTKGDHYFTIEGKPGFLYSRNLAGYQASQYFQLLDLTKAGGSKFVRLQLDSFGMGYTNTGKVDESWAAIWQDIFEKAAADGIYVMPTFTAWYDWNGGNGYSTWKSNPLNALNGGPAKTPAELFVAGSPTQKLWLGWMETLIERWQGQTNIVAWEPFSELNMVPGTTEPEAIDFVNSSASIVRSADPSHRPLTASLADFGDWSGFYRSDSLDFINIHPYPVSGKLDAAIVTEVHSMLAKYDKPVLIGESGLSFETPDTNPPTLTTADRAEIGIKHAIWAAMVSGAMNGRALWWEDGVAIYFPELSLPFIQEYANADLAASNFVSGVDFTGFHPLAASSSSGVWGAAIGSERMALGWYRDAGSEPPDWKLQPVLSRQTVTLALPGSAARWKIDFYDPRTGIDILSSTAVTREGTNITITLPDFTDDIAFKMYAQK